MKILEAIGTERIALTQRECAAVIILWALITHLYFRKYTFTPPNIFYTLGYLSVAPGLLSIPCIYVYSTAWRAVLVSYSLSYTSLLMITILYRIAPFHPLGRFPGPLLARVSKLWALRIASSGKQHLVYKTLHDKYGPIVRVGPNELSIVNSEAVQAVFGDGMGKGHLWEARRPPQEPIALPSIRDPHRHSQRRSAWNKALSSSSLKEFEPMLVERLQQLVDCLESNSNKRFDLTYWFSCFAFDLMGDMIFGGGFELMREGDKHGLKRFMASGMKNLALLHTIPWAARITWRMPKVAERIIRLREWSVIFAKRRKQDGSKVKDVFHYLINEKNEEGFTPDEIIVAESLVAIVAGSDSTASTLSGIFYHLMTNHSAREKLQEEIETTFSALEGNRLDGVTLASMPYLNAVINESLRLQPPLPIALQRTPLQDSGGKQVGTEFIPEGTAINLPPFVIHRDPRYFSPSPDSFIPERWLRPLDSAKSEDDDSIEYFTDPTAFIPFAGGFANCVGKNVALANIRMVVTVLMQKFDMRLAEGYDPAQWERDMEECFVLQTGELPVVLSPKA